MLETLLIERIVSRDEQIQLQGARQVNEVAATAVCDGFLEGRFADVVVGAEPGDQYADCCRREVEDEIDIVGRAGFAVDRAGE
jgi:hypothetical protein